MLRQLSIACNKDKRVNVSASQRPYGKQPMLGKSSVHWMDLEINNRKNRSDILHLEIYTSLWPHINSNEKTYERLNVNTSITLSLYLVLALTFPSRIWAGYLHNDGESRASTHLTIFIEIIILSHLIYKMVV